MMGTREHEDLLQQLLFLRTRYLGALARLDPSLLSLKYALAQEDELLAMLEERLTEAVQQLEAVLVERVAPRRSGAGAVRAGEARERGCDGA